MDCYHIEYKLGLYNSEGWQGRDRNTELACEHFTKALELLKGPSENEVLAMVVYRNYATNC